MLKEYVTEKPEGSVASPATSTPYNDSVYRQWQPVGKLVKEDGGFRFMDSVILGTIYDEVSVFPLAGYRTLSLTVVHLHSSEPCERLSTRMTWTNPSRTP